MSEPHHNIPASFRGHLFGMIRQGSWALILANAGVLLTSAYVLSEVYEKPKLFSLIGRMVVLANYGLLCSTIAYFCILFVDWHHRLHMHEEKDRQTAMPYSVAISMFGALLGLLISIVCLGIGLNIYHRFWGADLTW
ncbi:uncharacterized membrane protein YjfL (UPF0719 family) [Rhodoligotrophos appendicifer]|uniref:hypothetical protein n=1 Tax=Rhodoligotrophos appendicifer TaxID=987056 RepID=UPI0011852925|nr:hypothetical protein [Rhodoligotrophos appendicifer]